MDSASELKAVFHFDAQITKIEFGLKATIFSTESNWRKLNFTAFDCRTTSFAFVGGSISLELLP